MEITLHYSMIFWKAHSFPDIPKLYLHGKTSSNLMAISSQKGVTCTEKLISDGYITP